MWTDADDADGRTDGQAALQMQLEWLHCKLAVQRSFATNAGGPRTDGRTDASRWASSTMRGSRAWATAAAGAPRGVQMGEGKQRECVTAEAEDRTDGRKFGNDDASSTRATW